MTGGVLEHQGETGPTERVKTSVTVIEFPYPPEFSKLCVRVKEEIITLANVFLKACKGNAY